MSSAELTELRKITQNKEKYNIYLTPCINIHIYILYIYTMSVSRLSKEAREMIDIGKVKENPKVNFGNMAKIP